MARQVLIYLAIISGITAFVGLFLFIFGNSIEISCLRDAGRPPNCRISTALLGRVPISSRDVLRVTDVHVDEDCDDGCSYRAMLGTESGKSVPVNVVYTDWNIVERQVNAIQTYLDGTDESLHYVEPVQWWVVVMLGAMGLIPAGFIASHFLRGSRGF